MAAAVREVAAGAIKLYAGARLDFVITTTCTALPLPPGLRFALAQVARVIVAVRGARGYAAAHQVQ